MAGLIPFNRKKNDLLSTGFEDFHSMMDDFFTEGFPMRRSLAADTFKVDVVEEDTAYVVQAELPGVDKKDIQLSLSEGSLRIGVVREEEQEEKGKHFIHKERRSMSMERSIYLGEAEEEGIKAKLDKGVLSIHIPKKPHVETSKTIDID